MSNTIWITTWVVVVGGVFGWLWKTGQLQRFSNYVALTREELRKCTWPTVEELKGSTVIVAVSMLILGVFTVAVDLVFTKLVLWLT
jgi:preprotein translocase SecE subunit